MQMYLADCIFPDIEGQLAAYKSFCELWDSGEMAKADTFPGFEMLFRVHAPGAGRVTCLFKAESDAQIFEHFAPWRAQFGIEMDFTPVIGCQDVVDHHKKNCSLKWPEQYSRIESSPGPPRLARCAPIYGVRLAPEPRHSL